MTPKQDAKAGPVRGTRITKRVRAPKEANETPERARKRALDREAQRTFREKTKNYIAHLEQTVAACKAESKSELVSQLLNENAELYSTVERLRKIISDIYTATQPEILERNRSMDDSTSSVKDDNKRDEPGPASSIAVAKPAGSPLEVMTDAADADTVVIGPEPAVAGEVPVDEPFPSFLFTSATDPFAQDHTDIHEEIHLQSLHDEFVSSTELDLMIDAPLPVPDDLVAFAGDGVLAGGDPEGHDLATKGGDLLSQNEQLVSDQTMAVEQCQHSPRAPMARESCFSLDIQSPISFFTESAFSFNLWMQTNSIYSQIFAISPRHASEARNSDSGVLFKAIENGWSSLSYKEQRNPVIQILRGYDELVSKCLNQVNRLAIAYKNHLLIKYFLNRDAQDLQNMPAWQRPRLSQGGRKYPILVDFFAWPGLRERFIRGNLNVECTKFSAAYMRDFRFCWPFSYEDTYQYFPASDKYVASPLFERYHRDLRFWTMEECFFWEFPELTSDIHSSDCGSPDESTFPAAPFETPWLPTRAV